MSYHGTNVRNAPHYLGGDMVPPRLIARVLGGYGGLGSDAKKEALKAQQQGRSVPPLVSAELLAVDMLRPFESAVNLLPLSSAQKRAFLAAPLNFLLTISDPVFLPLGRAVDDVLRQKGNIQSYLGLGRLNLQRSQPVDAALDADTRNVVFKLRTLFAAMVLPAAQPLEFAAALFKQGLSVVGLHGLGSYGGLGVAGADDAAIAGIIAAVGPIATGIIGAVINAILENSKIESAAKVEEARLIATTPKVNAQVFPGVPIKMPPTTTPSPTTQTTGITPVIVIGGAAALAALLLLRR